MGQADFLNTDVDPATAVDLPGLSPDAPEAIFNRELSWLAFNWRVLEEAENPSVPLMERVRFLSISGSNLDEFYTVRVAGLRGLVREGVTRPSADGLSPKQQLERIDADARALMLRQQSCWLDLRGALKAEAIEIVGVDDLTAADATRLERVFMDQVFPVLTPLAIDPAHPFPFITNEGFAMALTLKRREDDAPLEALLPVPRQVRRIIR